MSQEHVSEKEQRVVILGSIESGKTSLINTVLGQTGYEVGKRTLSCVRREGEVCGRKLLFIDTPGWWGNFSLDDTAEFLKHKLVLSVGLCPPGPHAFLLVIASDSPFTEKNRSSVEDHLEVFGENIWDHTIVVFTKGEYLKNKSIEQHIEREGDTLKGVIEKCGNRYQMLCVNRTEGCNKVSKLLEQIDILAHAGKRHFKLDEKILKEIEEKRNTFWERAQQRRQKVMDQREIPHELRILLLGWLFSGKTTTMNTILGQKDAIRTTTYRPERKSGEVAGRRVTVMDTPGWWKYIPAKYTPEWVKAELRRAMSLEGKAPHAILLTIPVNTAFMEEQRKITEDNMKMFGEQVWRHTIVLFTFGDMLGDTTIEEHIECEGGPLQWLIEKCGHRYHVLSWHQRENDVLELMNKIEEMMAGICLFTSVPTTQERESNEEPAGVPIEMAHILDQKWKRMNEAMDKKVKNICTEMTEIMSLRNTSMNAPPELSDNTLEEMDSGTYTSPFEPMSSTKELGSTGAMAGAIEDPEQSSEKLPGQMKRITDMFEKEWGRRELDVTERFQCLLTDLREYGSEADVHDLNRSLKKVVWWMERGSSGFGSDCEAEEKN